MAGVWSYPAGNDTLVGDPIVRKPTGVPASNFVETLRENVDNDRLTDAQFRTFVRNTLPVVGPKLQGDHPLLDNHPNR